METILSYLQANAGVIFSAILGVGVIGAFIGKALSVLSAIIKLLEDLRTALADKKITEQEFDQIVLDAKGIPAAIKEAFKK